MIPFSDPSEPNRVFPYINIGLILLNFLVFFYELSVANQGTGQYNQFITEYGLVPCEYTSHCQVFPGTPSPFYVTMFTSIFMHGGWLHILGNMLYLWVFGDNIENSMGHFRYLIFYLLCGVAANGLEIATAVGSHVPGIGASGAIAGVLGAYFVLFPGSRIRTLIPITIILIPLRLPAWVLIGFWFVLQFIDGLAVLSSKAAQATGGVAYWAHIGGFIAGAILIWFFRQRRRTQQWQRYHTGPWARP